MFHPEIWQCYHVNRGYQSETRKILRRFLSHRSSVWLYLLQAERCGWFGHHSSLDLSFGRKGDRRSTPVHPPSRSLAGRCWLTILSLTIHNVHHLLSLMNTARCAIIEDRFPHFVQDFFARYYSGKQVPSWATNALGVVGITLNQRGPGQ